MKDKYEKAIDEYRKAISTMSMKKTKMEFDDAEDEYLYRKEAEAFGWDDDNEYDEMVESLKNGDVQIMDSNGNRMTDIDNLLASFGYDGVRSKIKPASRVRRGPMPTAADFETFTKEAVRALVEAGLADFVLLKNDKLRAWWQHVLAEELREQARLEEIERLKSVKEGALAKLSDEERAVLGIKGKK